MIGSLNKFMKEKFGVGTETVSGCRACGCCCDAFGGVLHASQADLKRWKELGREDLLAHAGETGWLWLDPETGQRLQRCPFLSRNSESQALCAIHEIKPDICRAYPTEATDRHCVCGVYFPVSLWSKKTTDLN